MLTVISLFSGAGGIDFGLEAAGFSTSVAVDLDPDCCNTLRANRRWPVIESDVALIRTKELLRCAGLKRGEADLLVGGPPCQPFSKSGYWLTGDSLRLEDPRASTIKEFFRVLEETLPRAFLLENVEGFSFNGKSEALRLVEREIRRINRKHGTSYKPYSELLNAADYGVPQIRTRFFMIAGREGQRFEFPEKTHSEEGDQGKHRYKNAWDAIGDVIPDACEDLKLTGKWAGLLPSIPEGNNYLWHTSRGGGLSLFGWRRRYWTFLLKLAKDRPSWTIQAQPGPSVGPFHWQNRRLSMRELCRLQTFPDDVTILGEPLAIQRQIGNAVPPLLAEILGNEIRAQILNVRRRRRNPVLLPEIRKPIPNAESVKVVPKRYYKFKGDHSPHPGTGKGYSAIER